MRKESLRRSANRYLKSDTRGSFKDKQNRAFVIHKMIDDLLVIPPFLTDAKSRELGN
jgi:hypothetical protein